MKEFFGFLKYGLIISIVFFSGFYGRVLDIGRFENVILLVIDFGIVVYLFYFK